MIVADHPPCDQAVVRTARETPGCASHARRWVLAATILGSSLTFMTGSIINVALPAIQESYGASLTDMQWVASAYTVLLAALTLTGGGMGDRFGRRRVFQAGVAALALASVAASLAASTPALIAARAAQGLAAALVVPNSLALLSAAFPRSARGAAVGTWSAATSIVGAVSPILGGWFVDVGSWRVAFTTIVPVALLTFVVTARRVPDPPVMRRAPSIDWLGAALATAGLLGVVSGIIAIDAGATAVVASAAGIAALVAFVLHERRAASPMIPPAMFGSPTFRGLNVLTFLLYFAVTGAFFLLPFDLVQVQHYSSTATGAAFLPFALLIGLLSPRVGALADRIGARPLLVAGPIVTAVGLAGFAVPGVGRPYWATFLAPMCLTGLGMALTVAPLTTSVLASVPPAQTGAASGVNNTVARVGTVLAVAVVGVVAVALYGEALDRRLAVVALPSDVARVLVSGRLSLADVAMPASLPTVQRALVEAVVHDAFLTAFRGAIVLCATLALVAGMVVAVTDTAIESSRADRDEPAARCEHLDAVADPTPRSHGCEQCARTGDTWVELRLCLSCGQVGCCDSSKNRHATEHFWASGHPIVGSLERDERWRWCYIDETVV